MFVSFVTVIYGERISQLALISIRSTTTGENLIKISGVTQGLRRPASILQTSRRSQASILKKEPEKSNFKQTNQN